jgi:hypothetical protein
MGCGSLHLIRDMRTWRRVRCCCSKHVFNACVFKACGSMHVCSMHVFNACVQCMWGHCVFLLMHWRSFAKHAERLRAAEQEKHKLPEQAAAEWVQLHSWGGRCRRTCSGSSAQLHCIAPTIRCSSAASHTVKHCASSRLEATEWNELNGASRDRRASTIPRSCPTWHLSCARVVQPCPSWRMRSKLLTPLVLMSMAATPQTN